MAPPFAPAAIARITGLVSTYGFAVVPVGYGACSEPCCTEGPSATPWTYTIGLMTLAQPELVVLGLSPRRTARLVEAVADRRLEGELLVAGDSIDVDGVPVRLEDVPDAWVQFDPGRVGLWFGWHEEGPGRRWGVGEMPVFQQLVWPDRDGWFPDDHRCDPHVAATQPVLAADPFSVPTPDGDDWWWSPDRRAGGRGRRRGAGTD